MDNRNHIQVSNDTYCGDQLLSGYDLLLMASRDSVVMIPRQSCMLYSEHFSV